ncbi:flagellar assembly protein A [Gracilibacillus xinjiangensis]|uniref:Flagellar assembly protein A n=1 Tax=Gracilibacillus xinjiangensis TaxID=1193282 RepID=A0ABV8WR67_9BACI
MQNIISKGKDIEEAIHLGLELLAVTKEDVDIEILQQGKNGFIGIGKKEAIVKLTKHHMQMIQPEKFNEHKTDDYDSLEELIENFSKGSLPISSMNPSSEENGERHIEKEREGTARVIDNKIYVRDSPNHYSMVTIGKGIKLIKNSSIVNEHSTVVSEKDQLEIQIEDGDRQETKWEVTIDNNGLNVILQVTPGFEMKRKVRDTGPDDHIELILEETKVVNNSLTYEDVLNKLEVLRVTYGINHSEITKAVFTMESKAFEIATGKAPKPGNDGWIEMKVDTNPRNGLVEDDLGNIDFKETKMIPTADKGRVIAQIHPPIPGIPGISVKNEPIPPKQTNPIKVRAGRGIVEVDDKIVAAESGRPSVEKRGLLVKVAIEPKLVHRNNVNLATGNIRFSGDVEVLGEVEENMTVEAGGDIFVHKSTSTAKLITSSSILVKGHVIGSELSAGKNNMLTVELGHLLGRMNVEIEKMISVIQQLTQSSAFKSNDFSVSGLQPLIKILLEKKFKKFTSLAKNYQEIVEKGKKYLDDEKWVQMGVSIKQTFLSLSKDVVTLKALITLSEEMGKLSEFSKTPVEPNAYITISDATNSQLYSNGDITIIGKGCINTKVHAGGHLNVKGVVRGGELYGRLGAIIDEVGSSTGTKTIISVPHDQTIHIRKALEDTVLKIGNVSHVLIQETYDIRAHLNRNNQIEIR